MPRAKKDGKFLNIKVKSDIYDILTKYCDESGQSKTVAVERAIDMYVKEYNKKKSL